MESAPPYETGLILSGGGARGFAHAGILKALNEAGIYPDIISGVSAGAIVGSLYADGHTPDEIYTIFSGEKHFFKYVKIGVPGKGLFKMVGLKQNIEKHLSARKFEDLKIPLFVAATNLNRGKVEYFHKGTILDKIMASASIPVLFEPVKIKGDLYVDGGVLDNFPTRPLSGKCKKRIGVYLNPIHPEKEFQNLFKVAERTFRLGVSANISRKLKSCDLFFEPHELGHYGLLDAASGKEMFELGYREASKILEKRGA